MSDDTTFLFYCHGILWELNRMGVQENLFGEKAAIRSPRCVDAEVILV